MSHSAPTAQVHSDGTHHIVMWCGLVLQQAYRAVLERGFSPPGGGVYISYYLFGSPAHKYKLVPKHWVVGEHCSHRTLACRKPSYRVVILPRTLCRARV